jgi:hypothetical protein
MKVFNHSKRPIERAGRIFLPKQETEISDHLSEGRRAEISACRSLKVIKNDPEPATETENPETSPEINNDYAVKPANETDENGNTKIHTMNEEAPADAFEEAEHKEIENDVEPEAEPEAEKQMYQCDEEGCNFEGRSKRAVNIHKKQAHK